MLMLCIGVASAVIVIALMMSKARRRIGGDGGENRAGLTSRDLSYAGMLWSYVASIDLMRSRVERSDDSSTDSAHSAYSWHGSHLDHGSHGGGGFSDGGGYGGGDGGGGGGGL